MLGHVLDGDCSFYANVRQETKQRNEDVAVAEVVGHRGAVRARGRNSPVLEALSAFKGALMRTWAGALEFGTATGR